MTAVSIAPGLIGFGWQGGVRKRARQDEETDIDPDHADKASSCWARRCGLLSLVRVADTRGMIRGITERDDDIRLTSLFLKNRIGR